MVIAATLSQPEIRTETKETVTGSSHEDRQSLRVWQAGNMRGYNELIERHKKPLFLFIQRMIRDAEEAKDVLQETFIRLYKNKDKLDENRNIKSWLFQTANNLSIDLLRKKKPDRVFQMDHQDPVFEMNMDGGGVQHSKEPRQIADEKHLQQSIINAIDQLPKKQRMIMSLRSCEGMSLSEIAEVMECSEKTVGTTLFAARQKLMKMLQPVMNDWYGTSPETASIGGNAS
jgi:RNA polymerase sigma-70 factor (ECF subfamily)